MRSLRSAKPCSLSRFLQNRQTFFAFFSSTVSLRFDFRQTFVLKLNRRVVFSGAFDYDSVLATSSTFRLFFFAHQSEASQHHPDLLSYMTSAERSPQVYVKNEALQGSEDKKFARRTVDLDASNPSPSPRCRIASTSMTGRRGTAPQQARAIPLHI